MSITLTTLAKALGTLLVAPLTQMELVWGVVPLYFGWVVNELTGSKASYGTAMQTGFALVWSGLHWIWQFRQHPGRGGIGQATVLKANWQRAAKGLGTSRGTLLAHVLPSAATATRGDSELLRQLNDVPDAERSSFLTDYLRREVQSFLRLAQPPSATSRFLELGTDSLMAVEFSNRLLPQFGGAFTISATAVFDYPTIGALADYLASQMPEPGDSESVGSS